MVNARTLLVVGDVVDEAAVRQRPRRDHQALREALDADVLHAGHLPVGRGRFGRGIALARVAARRSKHYDNVYCDSEHIGLPLAFLLRSKRPGPRLTMIAHYLTPPKKRYAIRLLRLHRRIDALALHSAAQLERASATGFRGEQLNRIPYQVDDRFWRPEARQQPVHIASAGREFRDYRTLLEAVRGLDIQVEVAAGSHWSTRRDNTHHAPVPANVNMRRRSYDELRNMYAAAKFVVVPLHDVDFQAGIITILEAMAMGKAVIVSRTRGQTGTVSGRLFSEGSFAEIGEQHGPETGIYVAPGDASALRGAIEHLLTNPEMALEMGAAGRRRVEAEFTLDQFVSRIANMIDPSHRGNSRPILASAG